MSFIKYAEFSQDLKSLMHNSPMWASMYDDEREVLDMLSSSLAQLVVDNPHDYREWDSIRHRAQIICDRIEKEKQKWDVQPAKAAVTTSQKTTAKVNAV